MSDPFDVQLQQEGFGQITFHHSPGFAEADPSYELRIRGKNVSCGDTPKEALKALLQRIDKLEQFKTKVEELVKGPYVPWAGRTGDYQ